MILKEKQLTNSQDPKIRAGEEAEKQMAFYLKRAFGKNNECYVLNDLRIVYAEDTAQIDHLIVTPFGLFIIESKSVHGRIIVNKRNEWSRTYNNRIEGMSSPILQAKAQGKVLRELLMVNKETLLGKALFGSLQKGFVNCKIFIYAAISDNGIIDREHDVKELFKADQICESIAAELDSLKRRNRLLSSNPVWEINLAETKTVADFLLNNHKPLINGDIIKVATSLAEPKVTPKPPSIDKLEKKVMPKVGAICPQCNQFNLVRKSVQRADGTETDFIACSGYPKQCKAIFALMAVTKKINPANNAIDSTQKYKENDDCPRCKSGKLKIKINKAKKTEFIGCSEFPKCRFNY